MKNEENTSKYSKYNKFTKWFQPWPFSIGMLSVLFRKSAL